MPSDKTDPDTHLLSVSHPDANQQWLSDATPLNCGWIAWHAINSGVTYGLNDATGAFVLVSLIIIQSRLFNAAAPVGLCGCAFRSARRRRRGVWLMDQSWFDCVHSGWIRLDSDWMTGLSFSTRNVSCVNLIDWLTDWLIDWLMLIVTACVIDSTESTLGQLSLKCLDIAVPYLNLALTRWSS